MSTTNDNGGCGWLILIIVLAALAITKPSEKAHRNAIAERTPIQRAFLGIGELTGAAKLTYHDYFFVSVITLKPNNNGREIPLSIGLFGKVYYDDDK